MSDTSQAGPQPGPEITPPAMPAPRPSLDAASLDTLFREARTPTKWLDRPVPDSLLEELYGLLKWAPTSANSSPARFVFVRSPEGKARLKPALSPGNIEKTMAAPVTVIVAQDPWFHDKLPFLFPQADARSWFASNWSLADTTATRNATLQGAYLMLAARALGLDAGPMSGFDNAKVDEAFLTGSGWRSNFLVNLGHADPAGIWPRNPRLTFDEACRLE